MFFDYVRLFRAVDRAWVERKILRLVTVAFSRVPFYRSLLKQRGLNPADFNSLEDYVDKFPRIGASAYRAAQQEQGHAWMLDDAYSLDDLIEDRSSGSSGIPVSIYRSPRENRANKAKTVWHLTRAGLRPWHRVLAAVPPLQVVKRDSLIQLLGFFRRSTVHYMMDVDEILDLIDQKRINAIYGQKSFLLLIADQYQKTGRRPPRLALLAPAAERVDKPSRDALCHTFHPARYAEIYGATETGIIAARYDMDYQVNYRSVFFCLSSPERQGELTRGSIAVTSLQHEVQPILMMELGDTVTVRSYDRLSDLQASIVTVDGRDNDYLTLSDGTRISGATFYAALEYLPFMRQFRIEQDDVSRCRVLLRLDDASRANRDQVEEILRSILSDKIRYEIHYVDRIPVDATGKTKMLVSRVP